MEGIVRFSYARFIDVKTTFAWDKAVFENSYFEYRIQAQNYPAFDKTKPFADFLKEVPDAVRIHHRVSTAVYENLNQLHGIIPQITDVNGELCLEFKQFKFEILDADFEHKNKYRVMVEFITEPMLCVGLMGDNFLIAAIENREKFRNNEEVTTRLLPFQKALNVYSYQKIV